MSRRLHLLAIPVAAVFCVLPLLRHGPSCGHDFDFHLLSWLEAARQISAGNLHPHWAFTPAFGAGEPRFVFYPPLSWTIGALLTLLFDHLPTLSPGRAFSLVPITYTFLALCSAGLAMFRLARRFTNSGAALLASTVYVANPYTLFTAYERTAYAELLAATWIPLLLLALLPHPHYSRASATAPRVSLLALSVALLWLTNAPAAVMGCYAIAVIGALHLLAIYRAERSLAPLLAPFRHLVAGTCLGLALSAFYIIPAAYERRWVQINMATIPGMRIADNTLFHHTADSFHDDVLHTASMIALLLLAATASALLTARLRTAPSKLTGAANRHLLALLTALTLAIAFLLTPPSTRLWKHLPELAFLQFPWRLCAILAAIFAFSVSLALRSLPAKSAVVITLALLLPAGLASLAYRSFQQACDAPDTPQAQLALFHSTTGSDPTDEYTPVTADNDALHPGTPAETCGAGQGATVSAPGPAPLHLSLDTTGCLLVLNLRDFPAWRIERNGTPVTERVERDDGLIAFHLPGGHSTIAIRYITPLAEKIGDAISLLALGLFVPLTVQALRRRRVFPPNLSSQR